MLTTQLPLWISVLGGASSGLNLMQGGYNFFKDIFGTDYSRSAQFQKDLMAAQFGYNRQLAEDQHNYNIEMAGLQNNYQKALMDMSQGYNLTNMQRQYLYNSFLSNKGRDIYAMRNSGVNPAQGTGSPSGSVSLPSAPQGAVGSLSSGLASVGSGASAPNSHYQPIDGQVGNTIRNLSESNLTDEQAYNQRIKNLFEAQNQLLHLRKMMIEIKRSTTASERESGELKLFYDTYENSIKAAENTVKKLEAEINSIPVHAEAAKVTSEAAAQNAQTQKDAQEETKRHNEQMERIQEIFAKNGSAMVRIEANKANAIINELVARESYIKAQKNLTDQDITWYAAKMESILELQDSQSKLNSFHALLQGKKISWFEYDKIKDTVYDFLGLALKGLSLKQKGAMTEAIMKHWENKSPNSENHYSQEYWDNY